MISIENTSENPSPVKHPGCDESADDADVDLSNSTRNLQLNPVEKLDESMEEPLVEAERPFVASDQLPVASEGSPSKERFMTENLALSPASVHLIKPNKTSKVPENEPVVPSAGVSPSKTQLTSPRRTSPRFKPNPPPAVQKVTSSHRDGHEINVKLETESRLRRTTPRTKANGPMPKKLTRAHLKYIMEMTTKEPVQETAKSRTRRRVNKANGIQKKVANKRKSSKRAEEELNASETSFLVDIENIKAEWEEETAEEQPTNTTTSISPLNKNRTNEICKLINEKENSKKNNRIVHPPEFTKIRKYTRKTSKSSTLFDNLKENTGESAVLEKATESPRQDSNLNGDEEDDDSDAGSTAEWMPEDYAEYKFNYSVKKLTNYKPQHKCKICLQILPSYFKLNKHLKIHLTQEKPYVCNQCNDAFSVLEDLPAHIRAVHQGKHPYQCKKCNKGFWSKNNLESHMPVHVLRKTKQPNKRFKCETCGKEFGKLCDMERHIRVHTGEKPCICNICQKRFQQAHNLSKHLLTHLHVKPFHCEICNKQFGRNDVLNRHLLTHSIEKPFKCSCCSKGFIRESQLANHMSKQHANADVKHVIVEEQSTCQELQTFVENKD